MTTTDGYVQRGTWSRTTDERGVRVRWDGMHHVVEVVVIQADGDPVVAREIGHFGSPRHAATFAANEAERTGHALLSD